MKKQYISSESMQKHRQIAHAERSQAFHESMKLITKSVKYIFSQPERATRACSKKLRHVQQSLTSNTQHDKLSHSH